MYCNLSSSCILFLYAAVPAINLIATIPASNSLDTEITSLKARQNNVNTY